MGINRWPGDGALIFAGSPTHQFNLWIPDRTDDAAQAILRLIEKRYASHGRGYLYVSGQSSLYSGKPQIVLTGTAQLSDMPPDN
jgi:micrococcal nuclease